MNKQIENKQITFSKIAGWTICMIGLSFCFCFPLSANIPYGKQTFRNVSVQQVGDVFEISFDTEIDHQSVGKTESLLLIPELISGTHNEPLPFIRLNGSNRCKTMKRAVAINRYRPDEAAFIEEDITRQTRKTIHYRTVVPYEEWMDNAVLTVHEELQGCAGTKEYFAYELVKPAVAVPVAQKPKTKVFNILDGIRPKVSYVIPVLGEKSREEKGSAYLDFPQGKSTILPTFRNNQTEINKIRASIDKVKNNSDLEVTSVSITGWASPEGNYTTNQQLSWDRTQALRSYLARTSGLPAPLINVQPGGEDWDTLRQMVENSNIHDRERILSIIDGWEDFDTKEQRLKSLGMSYNMLFNEYYPALRRVDYNIEYSVREYDRTESRDMLMRNPDHLSPYELYQVASNYEKESDRWNDIIELTVALHPNDPAANINAAGVLLNKGDLVAAKVCLDRVEDMPGAWNNLGAYYLYRGDLVKATEYLTKAMYIGVGEATYNMDIRRDIELYLIENEY